MAKYQSIVSYWFPNERRARLLLFPVFTQHNARCGRKRYGTAARIGLWLLINEFAGVELLEAMNYSQSR